MFINEGLRPRGNKTRTEEVAPPTEGTEIHKKLANHIKNGTRNGKGGEVLKAIEDRFNCKFLSAEMPVHGFAAKREAGRLKLRFWNGKIDAVGVHYSTSDGEKKLTNVFVAEWKTSLAKDMKDFWDSAADFSKGLHQCLLYSKILKLQLCAAGIQVPGDIPGIMLVPIDQKDFRLNPGLCLDFSRLSEITKTIDSFTWHPTYPQDLFPLPEEIFSDPKGWPIKYIDADSTLNDNVLLKEVIKRDAKIADLRQVFLLPPIYIADAKTEGGATSTFPSSKKELVAHDRSIKHQEFVKESMDGKCVIKLPGIGKATKNKLIKKGFDKAYKVLAKFQLFEQNEGDFRKWLQDTCGARTDRAGDCYECLKEWCDAHL